MLVVHASSPRRAHSPLSNHLRPAHDYMARYLATGTISPREKARDGRDRLHLPVVHCNHRPRFVLKCSRPLPVKQRVLGHLLRLWRACSRLVSCVVGDHSGRARSYALNGTIISRSSCDAGARSLPAKFATSAPVRSALCLATSSASASVW